ncbi:ABC transporter ATP-binding protein [Streptosporangium sp. NPDC004379]|uniref:ABC transporter ATP-binding protein n=1 Tax=Streptosporangium sp. NPDC004379 TaxID=3366189 RepID=UPI0036C04086
MILRVRDLRVAFPAGTAVDGIGFDLDRGRTLGVVGESGSGKSVSSLAIMGLHREAAVSGSIVFDGEELVGAPASRLRELRGRRMAMIFQDPLSSLHPFYTVGEQIAEAYRLHLRVPRRVARERAVEMLAEVGIPEPRRRAGEHPHRFSGGMRQRVMIAMALSCEPDLLIADEPTTALDVTVQAQILELIGRIQRDRGIAVMMITHDLGVVARVADEVLVMYGGRTVEHAPVREIFRSPRHPYTQGLLASAPRLPAGGAEGSPDPAAEGSPGPAGEGTAGGGVPGGGVAGPAAKGRLRAIPGSPPSLLAPPSGCRFHPRCARYAATPDDACVTEAPELRELRELHGIRELHEVRAGRALRLVDPEGSPAGPVHRTACHLDETPGGPR